MGKALALLLCALASAAHADGTRTHVHPDGPTETCQLLVPFPIAPPDLDPAASTWYRDEDSRDIEALCAIDLHAESSTAATAVGVCPKIHGTMPGLEIYDLDGTGLSKRQFESARCKIPGRGHGSRGRPRGAVKLAKYKTAAFISEPESMLLYFHFSRLLGNLAHVQPATWRTLDRARYRRWAADGIARLAKADPKLTTLDGWQVLDRLLDPRTLPRPRIVHARERLVVDDLLVWGALVENPRGERERQALCLTGGKNLAHPTGWRQYAFYRLVNSRRPLAEQRFTLQQLACARDYTDMVVLDTLFNQIDRMGNVHQKTYYHSVDDRGRMTWSSKQTPGAVPLTRLLLKDNDDGLKWSVRSLIVAFDLLGDIHHMDPTVYARIQWLAGLMMAPASAARIKTWFTTAVHVREVNYDHVRDRFVDLAARLQRAHDRGQLLLDLDLAAAVAAAATPRPPSAPRSASAGPPAR
ncbi:MAG TPA: hypothetical protein VL172_11845 [Kofleriaceae bacterium]|nr:hypothetical protein [Kofleriaceae bacterium]